MLGSPDVGMSGCRDVRMSGCRDVGMSGCPDVRMSGCLVVSVCPRGSLAVTVPWSLGRGIRRRVSPKKCDRVCALPPPSRHRVAWSRKGGGQGGAGVRGRGWWWWGGPSVRSGVGCHQKNAIGVAHSHHPECRPTHPCVPGSPGMSQGASRDPASGVTKKMRSGIRTPTTLRAPARPARPLAAFASCVESPPHRRASAVHARRFPNAKHLVFPLQNPVRKRPKAKFHGRFAPDSLRV